MARFKIVAPVPFEVEGVDGKVYKLPFVKDMNANHIAMVGEIIQNDDLAERMIAIKSLILSVCPELEDEPITDEGFTKLFAALGETDEDETKKS